MKVAAVADVHLGNFRKFGGAETAGLNDRCRAVLAALGASVVTARERGSEVFLVAGDLFDNDAPPPQLVAAVQDILAKAKETMEVVLLVGNHDQKSTTPGDHALGPFREWATIVDKPTVLMRGGAHILCLPYDPRPAVEWFAATVDEFCATAPVDLLAVHLGIMDDNTPPWLRDARDAVSAQLVLAKMKEHDIRWGVAGNWHNHAAWGDEPSRPNLVQCGALVPTGWDNEGVDGYGGLVLFDGPNVAAEVIPGPRFVKVRNASELKKAEKRAKSLRCSLYVRFTADPELLGEATAELDAARARSVVLDGEAEADGKLVAAAARTAAHGARKAETLDEALAAFVGSMPLDDDLDREEVRALCAGYLGGGR